MEKRDLVFDRASSLCTGFDRMFRNWWLVLDLNLHALRRHSLDHHGLTGGSAGWYLYLDLLAI